MLTIRTIIVLCVLLCFLLESRGGEVRYVNLSISLPRDTPTSDPRSTQQAASWPQSREHHRFELQITAHPTTQHNYNDSRSWHLNATSANLPPCQLRRPNRQELPRPSRLPPNPSRAATKAPMRSPGACGRATWIRRRKGQN